MTANGTSKLLAGQDGVSFKHGRPLNEVFWPNCCTMGETVHLYYTHIIDDVVLLGIWGTDDDVFGHSNVTLGLVFAGVFFCGGGESESESSSSESVSESEELPEEEEEELPL